MKTETVDAIARAFAGGRRAGAHDYSRDGDAWSIWTDGHALVATVGEFYPRAAYQIGPKSSDVMMQAFGAPELSRVKVGMLATFFAGVCSRDGAKTECHECGGSGERVIHCPDCMEEVAGHSCCGCGGKGEIRRAMNVSIAGRIVNAWKAMDSLNALAGDVEFGKDEAAMCAERDCEMPLVLRAPDLSWVWMLMPVAQRDGNITTVAQWNDEQQEIR